MIFDPGLTGQATNQIECLSGLSLSNQEARPIAGTYSAFIVFTALSTGETEAVLQIVFLQSAGMPCS
jgi:predicted Holliday junction resolvase-like endonuclease